MGRLERGAITALSAVMRSVVDGPLMVLSAPPFSPVPEARGGGVRKLSPIGTLTRPLHVLAS